jgi:hypothetical protein
LTKEGRVGDGGFVEGIMNDELADAAELIPSQDISMSPPFTNSPEPDENAPKVLNDPTVLGCCCLSSLRMSKSLCCACGNEAFNSSSIFLRVSLARTTGLLPPTRPALAASEENCRSSLIASAYFPTFVSRRTTRSWRRARDASGRALGGCRA